ncbi:ArsR/SmtB family transcription factor [Alcanivorax quisquiliarum]|uniref:Metalloregulator ArsR/SmtB family transcription factor n=1 Tax=Alcanivorax quisquiliarum TaxID=2933565 RepID=A0ABT0E944_9GAMM|nr:metalloregulator ArsR/SmtB family transcription factor [Alcanivorax quisquiliarum]MCK0538363.1 metalloregulator ArsR/SmtB family transcription factor [Alcanivorax quisquiliarum]
MDTNAALDSFAALSQETRLKAFQLLVRHEPEGLPAGQLARLLAVPHNTLSAHLGVLARAGWVLAERQGRSIIYRAHMAHMKQVIRFLVRDCCDGHPDACEPLLPRMSDI